ncbi:MAG: Wzz/FepE/Etk N-terminal domain-containing protein [Bacteroidales bacterium]|jgi:uncharacterized protein involved in exopolysaccharide biosynthesis|nr:Wzz/FepE/Etk N-terminal domain-containing protein [Bacteroidales bacterium]
MKEQDKYSRQFEAENVLDLIIRRRMPLLIIIFAAAVLSAVASLTIQPKYKSTVTLFPVSSSSISQALMSQNSGEKEILKFGEEEEVEQMMQVLQSNTIRNRVIEKYKLMQHYGIDPKGKYPATSLYENYKKNIKINRTEFMSVDIVVLDHSPDTAALIANEISAQLDSVMNDMQKDRALKAFRLVEIEYNKQKQKIRAIRDTLEMLGEIGIVEYESQSEVFNDQYAIAIAQGNYTGASRLKEKIDTLAKYGPLYVSLHEQMTSEIKKLSEVESKYVEAKIDVEQNLPHKFVVNEAVNAEKKSYPVRWLIVMISTISSFLLAIIVLIILENLKKK